MRRKSMRQDDGPLWDERVDGAHALPVTFAERVVAIVGRPRSLGVVLVLATVWMGFNVAFRGSPLAFDPAPFRLLIRLNLSMAAILLGIGYWAQRHSMQRLRSSLREARARDVRLRALGDDVETMLRIARAHRSGAHTRPTQH